MNSIILISIILIMLYLYIFFEFNDRNVLNNEYSKTTNNSSCMQYMRILNAYPWWRVCVVFGIINTLFVGAFLKLNTNDKKIFWNVFWFALVTNILILYKFVAHWQWHYVSNDGGLTNAEYTSNN